MQRTHSQRGYCHICDVLQTGTTIAYFLRVGWWLHSFMWRWFYHKGLLAINGFLVPLSIFLLDFTPLILVIPFYPICFRYVLSYLHHPSLAVGSLKHSTSHGAKKDFLCSPSHFTRHTSVLKNQPVRMFPNKEGLRETRFNLTTLIQAWVVLYPD